MKLACPEVDCTGTLQLTHTTHSSHAGKTYVCHGICDVCHREIEGVFKAFFANDKARDLAFESFMCAYNKAVTKKKGTEDVEAKTAQ